MRLLALTAALLCPGAALAVPVTFTLDLTFDTVIQEVSGVGYVEDYYVGPASPFSFRLPPAPDPSPISVQIAFTFESALVDLTEATVDLAALPPGALLGDVWPPPSVDTAEAVLEFDAQGEVRDWRIATQTAGGGGYLYDQLLTPQEAVRTASSLFGVGNEAWQEALYGPRPYPFVIFVETTISLDSSPGSWTRSAAPVPVPLPAAAGLLLAGLAALGLAGRWGRQGA